MTTLYVKKHSFTETTREPTSGDDWDRGDTDTSWSFDGLALRSTGGEKFETDFDVKMGDVVFAVFAVHSTGDSFGNDTGYCSELMEVFKAYDEANVFKDWLESAATYTSRYNEKDYHIPWIGYFEGLDYVTVEQFTVTEI